MRATMALTCSYGAPFLLVGVCAPPKTPTSCCSSPLVPPPTSSWVWGGEGVVQFLGAAPHLLYQATHEWRVLPATTGAHVLG